MSFTVASFAVIAASSCGHISKESPVDNFPTYIIHKRLQTFKTVIVGNSYQTLYMNNHLHIINPFGLDRCIISNKLLTEKKKCATVVDKTTPYMYTNFPPVGEMIYNDNTIVQARSWYHLYHSKKKIQAAGHNVSDYVKYRILSTYLFIKLILLHTDHIGN